MPDPEAAFAAFCTAGLWPGVGRTLAADLAAAGIRRADDVSARALSALPGLSQARADRLMIAFGQAAPQYDAVEVLIPAGLPARLAGRAVEVLGKAAAAVLTDDPWRLLELPEVKVVDADRLAVATVAGVSRQDPRRGTALVAWALGRAARDGHTALPADTVTSVLAGEQVLDPAAAVAAAVDSGRVLAHDDDLLGLERYAMAEEAVADGVARLLATARPLTDAPVGASATAELDATQRQAVANALDSGVSLLTGGPGTGKSRTVAAVVALAEAAGCSVALAAPTGRAAKRLEELAGAPATTVHRLLGAQGRTGSFARGEAWPVDAQVVVVDETSMLDAELAAALVEACADGTHLMLVGDPAQLPSIGAGRVLGDLIEADLLPVAELTTLYRQAEGGSIARLATAVRGGDLPPVDDPTKEVVVVSAAGAAEAAHRTVQLVTDAIPRALGIPAADVQVVTPVHRGPAGTVALNEVLKARLNPGAGIVSGFDAGDRVVATANHLDLEPVGFANGEVGTVTDASDGVLTVAFAAGPVSVSGKALADLRHGWAITVHRAQGSEWPAVVSVLPAEAGGLLSRPLVYTGFTRARRHLSVVHACGPALVRAVRQVRARPRRTRLTGLLRSAVGAGAPR
ncbi:MAG: AAA family ATPase [Actinomycetota bacterium]|nr:AAA family ATPase [Actinomycetota bacterium]